jgi:hypothetical protein
LDDVSPGGPKQVLLEYKSPFAVASRDEDYRMAWEFFEKQ